MNRPDTLIFGELFELIEFFFRCTDQVLDHIEGGAYGLVLTKEQRENGGPKIHNYFFSIFKTRQMSN
jgi:hypothetical protein